MKTKLISLYVLGVALVGVAAGLGPAASAREDPALAAELDIALSWGEAERPSRAYVAVVPEDRPWAEPAREEVLDEESSMTWALEPGRYRFVAGAPGFVTHYSPIIDLPRGRRHLEKVELLPFVAVSGRVVDQQGQPVAGARVGRLRAYLDQFSLMLSPRGEEVLASNFLRHTDEQGRFEFPLHPSAGQFLWVEAEGHSPHLLRNVRWGGPGSSLGVVKLAEGGALEVHWDPPRKPEGANLRLQLVPGDQVPLGLITPRDARAVWARGVSAGGARWPSLPPGTYELWLKGPPYADHRLVPRRVARLAVEPGETTSRAVELPKLGRLDPGAGAGGERPAAADASLLLPGVRLSELEELAVVAWSEEGWRQVDGPEAEAVSGGARIDLLASCSEGSVFVVQSSERVGVSKRIGAEECERSIRVVLHPRSTLKGRFLPPQGEQLPGSARILLRPCESGSDSAEQVAGRDAQLVVPAALSPEGELASPVPAGCFETAVSVSRFAVTEGRTLMFPEGGVRTLPATRLLPGGAILARVVSGTDGLGLEGVRVRALEGEDLPHLYDDALRADALVESAPHDPLAGSTSDQGWVRLYGLRPGTWRLALSSEERRYPHVSGAIEIRSPAEVVLDPLELPPPAFLTIEVERGSAFDSTVVEPVRIHARGADPRGPLFNLQIDQSLGPDGAARLRQIPPGLWSITGVVRLESGRLFPASEKTIEVPPGGDVHTTLLLDEPLFRGVVTHRGEPVEGAVVLTPLPHDGRRKMTVRVEEDGTFTVPLERAGSYRAEVTSRDGQIIRAVVPEVEFEDPDREVAIDLTAGRISGFVLDPEGRPVPGAAVEAGGAAMKAEPTRGDAKPPRPLRRRVRTDEDGAFVFEAVSAGSWTLRASDEDLVGGPYELELGSNEERNGILLELASPSRVEVLVTAQGVLPQPRVEVLATLPPASPGAAPEAARGVTDERGVVTIDLAERTDQAVNLMLRSTSGVATAKRAVLRDGATVELGGGSSELRLRIPKEGPGLPPPLLLVAESGAYLNPRWAGAGAFSSESGAEWLVVPKLSNGRWRLVEPRSAGELFLVTTGRGHELPATAEVTLSGAPVELDLAGK